MNTNPSLPAPSPCPECGSNRVTISCTRHIKGETREKDQRLIIRAVVCLHCGRVAHPNDSFEPEPSEESTTATPIPKVIT